MRKLITLFLCSILAEMLSGQTEGRCGQSIADQFATMERRTANIQTAMHSARDRGAVMYIPIHFHLTADANGEGRVKTYKVLDQLCELNEEYLEYDMQYYLSPHPTQGLFDKSINANDVYTTQTNFFAMQGKRHNNALNVYVTDKAVPANAPGTGTVLAYYNTQRDWIVCRRDKINGNDNNNTLGHEIGHFFSLAHTFFGWESDEQDPQNEPPCFDPADPGWPKAPNTINGVPVERVNGSNGLIAADGFVDTPADYNFGFCQGNCVEYSGPATDPLNAPVHPMTNNFMSYYDGCADFIFTPNQADAMHADLNSTARNFLDNTFSPSTTAIDPAADFLLAPAQNSVTPFYNNVLLEWQAVPGATYYLVETDRTNSFSSIYSQEMLVTATSVAVTNLEADKTYYWRVRPFNVLSTCSIGKSRSFKTGTAISETLNIEELTTLNISPNPVEGGELVTLLIQASSNFDANIAVLDETGRQVYAKNGEKVLAGNNKFEIPTAGLANGLYFVQVQSEKGRRTERLAIVR